jgi:hypothetical protein
MAQASLSVSWRAGPLWLNNEVPDVLRNDDTFDINECTKVRPRIAPRPAAVPRYIRPDSIRFKLLPWLPPLSHGFRCFCDGVM